MKERFAGIREFVAAMDQGSFTAAAAQLGVTGSAIGKSISRLEARLGVQLLHRTTRRLDLTTDGEAYLLTCRRILEELDEAEAFLATGHQQPVGQLRVDLPTTFGRRHILPTLLNLGLRHEGLDLAVALQDRTVDMVSEGVDLAVRIGELADYPDLIARRLGEQRLVICASPDYLKRRSVPASYADLAQHDCLVGWRQTSRAAWFFRSDKGTIEPFDIAARHELTDGDALLHACIAGCGLAQLPTWLADEALQAGALKTVLSDITGGVMPIHVMWQKTRHLQPKVRLVVDELLQLAENAPGIFFPDQSR